MACDDCGASGCLCIESIGPGLSWDGSELGFDEGGLAADLLSTDACQVLTLGTDGKLFTRERAAGWGVSTVVGPQLFSGAGIPASARCSSTRRFRSRTRAPAKAPRWSCTTGFRQSR